jgi:hypothetical protein
MSFCIFKPVKVIFFGEQLLEVSGLDDFPLLKDEDDRAVSDGFEAVCDAE